MASCGRRSATHLTTVRTCQDDGAVPVRESPWPGERRGPSTPQLWDPDAIVALGTALSEAARALWTFEDINL